MNRLRFSNPLAVLWISAVLISVLILAQSTNKIRANYSKAEYQITMRDGVKLFTSVYMPKDTSQSYPILMNRTPYSVAPYGPDTYRDSLGPSSLFSDEKYIFVYQDVRGRYMSEGSFKWMTPYKPKKAGPSDADESTDTYDTIDWLIKNIPNNNGRVGMWGISFPGHYTAQAIIDAHPALKAASPQAPMGDNWLGDDMHHNGAFWLPHAFNFISTFGLQPPVPTAQNGPPFVHGTPDGYKFFLDMGPLANANARYLHDKVGIWNEWMEHGDYDSYWQSQNVPQYMTHVRPAVMTVGGWFDAEDLWGPLHIYESIEQHNPKNSSMLVMGPWFHGGWARGDGDFLGNVGFGSKTSAFYRENIELPFFDYYLKDKGTPKLPEAFVFETGSDQWRQYEHWPPQNVRTENLYIEGRGKLGFAAPVAAATKQYEEYVSDPAHPVPYINQINIGMTREYMDDDQRFTAAREDVLTYQTDPLADDVTLAGPIKVDLTVSTSGTDSDYVVKLIDVFPNDAKDDRFVLPGEHLGGYQMLIRGEPMRAKYRTSWSKPEAMPPNTPTSLKWEMPDINHTFLKGHRIMLQIQSSWFPLVDRNPQKFVNIYKALEGDFQKATERVYFGSHITVGRLDRSSQNR
jgi:putative CocE/NonD family hydrolase